MRSGLPYASLMKIFLDIGAHIGETLSVVLDPEWKFDRVICFEPAPVCWPALQSFTDERLTVHHFGLWSRSTQLVLNNPGSIGASVAHDKNPVLDTMSCTFEDAGVWFAENVRDDDIVYAKINVEGAEAEIIDRLCESGEIGKIGHLLIHFDVRKVPSLRDREPRMRWQLLHSGVDFVPAHEIQFGGAVRGTRNWLRWCASASGLRNVRYKTVERLRYHARLRLRPLKRLVMRHRRH